MAEAVNTEVLNHRQILDKIKRIAWQIYENQSEGSVVIAGIAERGFLLAQKIAGELEKISPLQIQLHKIILDKKNLLQSRINLEPEVENLSQKTVIVADDVLNSGSTLIYGVRYFLQFDCASIKTAVLVDRNHKRFPVKADFKGLSLSTSMMEHVDVQIEREPYSVRIS